jgi:hypothetical protein
VTRLRAALRWLDPWAVLLLGVLISLGVIILLATPGPWRKVVGEARQVRLAPSKPSDIAVFVQGGRGTRCTGVVWLHADYENASLTACVLAPSTQGLVHGGGYAPVDRLVTDVGAKQASVALGAALGVTMDAWATVSREALLLAAPTMFPSGERRAQRRQYRRALAAWAGAGGTRRAWRRQYEMLAAALPDTPFGGVNIVTFSNYVLGFGYVESDLDLQGAASLAQLLKGLKPGQARVRAVPAIEERCRGARAWRVDTAATEQLRGSLTFGAKPPVSLPVAESRRVASTVVVAEPPRGVAGRAYLKELRLRLRSSAGYPVRVERLRLPAGCTLAAAVDQRLDQGRPLAVLVAAGLAPRGDEAEDVARQIREVAAVLQDRAQPSLVCAPATSSAGAEALESALQESALPVGRTSTLAVGDGPVSLNARTARIAARVNAATLVRACWPGALAPRLLSTRIGFAYAAAVDSKVSVVGLTPALAERVAARLCTYGFAASAVTDSAWSPPLQVEAVYHRPGGRRAAVVVADDRGLGRAAVMADPEAPAGVTLSLVK